MCSSLYNESFTNLFRKKQNWILSFVEHNLWKSIIDFTEILSKLSSLQRHDFHSCFLYWSYWKRRQNQTTNPYRIIFYISSVKHTWENQMGRSINITTLILLSKLLIVCHPGVSISCIHKQVWCCTMYNYWGWTKWLLLLLLPLYLNLYETSLRNVIK